MSEAKRNEIRKKMSYGRDAWKVEKIVIKYVMDYGMALPNIPEGLLDLLWKDIQGL